MKIKLKTSALKKLGLTTEQLSKLEIFFLHEEGIKAVETNTLKGFERVSIITNKDEDENETIYEYSVIVERKEDGKLFAGGWGFSTIDGYDCTQEWQEVVSPNKTKELLSTLFFHN